MLDICRAMYSEKWRAFGRGFRKRIAELFVFDDSRLYCTEADSPRVGLFEGRGLFVRKQHEGGDLLEGGYLKEGA